MLLFFLMNTYFWGFCVFIFTIGQLKSGQETGEREGMTFNKGPQGGIESVTTVMRRQPLYMVCLLYQLSHWTSQYPVLNPALHM